MTTVKCTCIRTCTCTVDVSNETLSTVPDAIGVGMIIERGEEGDGAHLLASSSRGGPTVLRILLGTQLRRLRLNKGVTREDAGYAIRGSHAKISRLELG